MMQQKQKPGYRSLFAMIIMGAVFLAGASWLDAGEKAAEQTYVLGRYTYWRWHVTLKPPLIQTADGAVTLDKAGKAVHRRFLSARKKRLPVDQPSSAYPPAKWFESDFDASQWAQGRTPVLGGGRKNMYSYGLDLSPAQALLCMRAKFGVTDPAKVKDLNLSVIFRGGLVVYLNGKEVARANMPKGDLKFDTSAEVYPAEAHCQKSGKEITSSTTDMRKAKKELALRIRKATDVKLPLDGLKKGVNVLALQFHRAPINVSKRKLPFTWGTVGCISARLKTSNPEGLTPNADRPAGLQVWNANLLNEVTDRDFADPHEPLRPVRIVGTRNGVFSGQVAVGSEKAIAGLKAECGALKLKDGAGEIPATAVQVRFPQPGSSNRALLAKAPAKVEVDAARKKKYKVVGSVQAIWVGVRVPADAAPGEYEGTLTVSANGAEAVKVPVALKVCGWKLPEPRAFHSLIDFCQSTDTLAQQYKVPLWSDEHFKLIEKSFALLAELGNNTVYIPLLCKTHFGNEQTMVRWIKQDDGTFKHDYSVMDRYLDLAQKYFDPRVVGLYVWDYYMVVTAGKEAKGALVSVLDPATKKVTEHKGPSYADPKAADFWKPVAAGIQERLKKRGIDKAMMIFICGDKTPSKGTVELWKTINPELKWINHAHPLRRVIHGQPMGYSTTGLGARYAVDPAVKRTQGWKQGGVLLAEFARLCKFTEPLARHRLLMEWNISGNLHGIGRLNGDFWKLPGAGGAPAQTVVDRFRLNDYKLLTLNFQGAYLRPGSDGAVWTLPIAMMREGIQEAEARIFIEKALADPKQREKLGDEKAKSIQALLDKRTRYNLWTGITNYGSTVKGSGLLGFDWFAGSGWAVRSEKLFEVAAEVAGK